MQFEVIHQDNDVRSIYREFTDASHDGYHQLAYWAEDFDAALAASSQRAGRWSGRADRTCRPATPTSSRPSVARPPSSS